MKLLLFCGRVVGPSEFLVSGQKPLLALVHKLLPDVTLKDLEKAFEGTKDDLM